MSPPGRPKGESSLGEGGAQRLEGSPATAETRPPRLAALLFGTMTLQAVATAFTLAVPVLTPTLPGATLQGVGWYMTLLYLGAMASAAWSGPVIGRLGPMRASQVALLLQIGGLALALPGDAGLRLAGALFCGLGYGPVTPASSQILARHTPPGHVGLVFSIKQTGVPLGGLLAGLLLLPVASLAGWSSGLLLMIALGVASLAICSWLHRLLGPAAPRVGTAHPATPWYRHLAGIWRHPGLRATAMLSMCFSVVQLSLSGYLVLYLHQELGLTLVQAGMIFSFAQGAGILGRLGWGRLADVTRAPNAVLMAIALLMGLASLLLGLATPAWWLPLLVLLCAVFGATAIGWNGLFLAEVARLAPAGAVAGTTGAVLFYTYTGVVVGPLLFGQAGNLAGSLGVAFAGLAAVPALALLILWRQRRRAR